MRFSKGIGIGFCAGIFILASCHQNDTAPAQPFQEVKKRRFDPKSGYNKGPIYGEEIQPLMGKTDTLITGVPLKIDPVITHISSMQAPRKITISKPVQVLNNTEVSIPLNSKSVTSKLLDSSKLKKEKITFAQGNSTFVPPRPIKAKLPKIISAGAPIYKGKALRNIKYLDIQQGTNSSYIWDVFKDSRGYIWMGTNAGGVSMYDGSSFRHFTTETGLPSNNVWCINEDPQGNMWFGTWGGGFVKYDGEQFFNFGKEQGILSNESQSILVDSKGNLWLCTAEEVAIYDGKTIKRLTEKEGLIAGANSAIIEDKENRIWISTDKGISMVEGDSIVNLTTDQGLSSNNIYCLDVDNEGNIWIGHENTGIDVFDGRTFTNYNTSNYLPNNFVYDIRHDKNNNMWIATYGSGICYFDNENAYWINESNGLSGDYILRIELDNSGNVWAGSDGDGVNIINLNSFMNYAVSTGMYSDYIYSICQDEKGTVWFGAEHGEVMIYSNDKFYSYDIFDSLSDLPIQKIFSDSKGNLWFATEDSGVWKLNGTELTIYKKENGLENKEFNSIMEDDEGLMWFGSAKSGIYSFDGNVFKHYKDEEVDQVKSICKDHQGNLYFTSLKGILKYDGSAFTRISMKEGLNSNRIVSSMVDSKGNCWFGSESAGACMFNGKTFHYFSTQNGLCNNRVWSILEDPIANSIWFATEKGLSEMNLRPFENSDISSFTSYTWNDGLRAIDFLPNSALLDASGILWWGGGKSLVKLKTRTFLHRRSSVQKLYLKSLNVNDKYVDFRSLHDTLRKDITYGSVRKFNNIPENLSLNYDKNHLTFHFSAIDWKSPQNILYSYKLKGLNENWSHPSKEPFADFTNIPHGDYTFMVRAKSSDGKWSKALEYPFTIHPPWWLTLWAKTIYIVLGMLTVWGVILIRTRRLKLRQLKLVKEIKKATKEIRDKKDEVERQKSSNLEMSKRILEQDKQIILSETANTVAHGLNSPLGAIKAGTESMQFLYKNLFSNGIKKCTTEQVLFGFNYAQKFNGEKLISGKELIRKTEEIEKVLKEDYGMGEREASILSSKLNKIYLERESSVLLPYILKQKNRDEVIEMISSLVSFQQITINTLNATEQSSMVVDSLKKALRQGRVEEKSTVVLKDSISAVLEVLEEDFEDKARITMSIDSKEHIAHANQYKFFQLWSNLFTIIVNGSDKKVDVLIHAKRVENHLQVDFKTNIEMDKKMFKDSVYDIIMHRKQNSLDLSRAVIKNIVSEHAGDIHIEKNEQGTTISLKFKNDVPKKQPS